MSNSILLIFARIWFMENMGAMVNFDTNILQKWLTDCAKCISNLSLKVLNVSLNCPVIQNPQVYCKEEMSSYCLKGEYHLSYFWRNNYSSFMVFLLRLLKNIKNISTILNVKTLFFARRKQYFQYTCNNHGNFHALL